ncbi:MAG: 4Fe-4S dicluster domain-containing protein [Acidobacteriota bacterium]
MGKVVLSANRESREFIKAVEVASGTRTSLCYQCGKCSAGCPVAFAMDYTPRQIIRLLQLGLVDEAVNADSIWICATCETCSSRCPRGVEIASLMDTLRREALHRGIITDHEVNDFNKSFLNSVERFGRLHEASMVIEYNLRIVKPLKDAELSPQMLKRGKLKILPEKIKGQKAVKAIFQRVKDMGGE